jgi:hypothetical protein
LKIKRIEEDRATHFIYVTIILSVLLLGCEFWCLSSRDEHGLGEFQNQVLRRIFGPKKDEVISRMEKTAQ